MASSITSRKSIKLLLSSSILLLKSSTESFPFSRKSLLIGRHHQHQCLKSLSQQKRFYCGSSLRSNAASSFDNNNNNTPIYNPLDENIEWKTYSFPVFGEFQIAEAKQYDPIFDHCIANELPEPFGIMTWDSSILMANLLEEKIYPEGLFQDKIVCDLGSGTGLSSLLCFSKLAAQQIIALDYNSYSLELLQLSFERYCENHQIACATSFAFVATGNHSNHSITITPPPVRKHERFALQCFDMEQHEVQWLPYCHYLLLSDILYTEGIARAAAERVIEAILTHDTNVIVTDPGRSTAQLFVKHLHERSKELLSSQPQQQEQEQQLSNSVRKKLTCLQSIQFTPFPSSTFQEKNDIRGQYLWIG